MPGRTAPRRTPSTSSKRSLLSRTRPLLLEALFVAENMATGPQHFDHAFEIEERFI